MPSAIPAAIAPHRPNGNGWHYSTQPCQFSIPSNFLAIPIRREHPNVAVLPRSRRLVIWMEDWLSMGPLPIFQKVGLLNPPELEEFEALVFLEILGLGSAAA